MFTEARQLFPQLWYQGNLFLVLMAFLLKLHVLVLQLLYLIEQLGNFVLFHASMILVAIVVNDRLDEVSSITTPHAISLLHVLLWDQVLRRIAVMIV